jgi:hypothetical protein
VEKRYRSGELIRFPNGDGSEFVFCRESQSCRIIPTPVVRALVTCHYFDTLQAHAARVQQGGDTQDTSQVLAMLDQLVNAGLLIPQSSHSDHGSPYIESQLKVTTLCLVSKDRPELLAATLRSYTDACIRFDRALDFVVGDDSWDPAIRTEYLGRLKEFLVEPNRLHIWYAGREHRELFAEQLRTRSGIPGDVIRFALTPSPFEKNTVGANRNAMLLQAAGELMFWADDDIACHVGRPPNATSDGLAFFSGYDPAEIWFYRSREDALHSVSYEDVDLLSLHEKLLGRSIASCTQEATAQGKLRSEPSYRFLADMCRNRGRVLVTLMGLVGDCGMEYPNWFWLDARSRKRLMASRELYETAFASREILAVAPSYVISSGTFCMCGANGIDNTDLIPPYFPVGRSEDGLFGVTLRRCYPDGYFGHIPWAIVHEPPAIRRFAPEDKYAAVGCRISDILTWCVEAFPPPVPGSERERNLRRLGQHLMELGRMELHEFEEFVKLRHLHSVATMYNQMKAQLKSEPEVPNFWRTDVDQYLDALVSAATAPMPLLPRDITCSNIEEARQTTQRYVRQYGELLWWWPDIFAATMQLKRAGTHLAARVSE